MSEDGNKSSRHSGRPSPEGFLKTVFGFFTEVLKGIAGDSLLRVAWGVIVLLLVVLMFMVLFGGVGPEQGFQLALVVVAAVVATFVFSAWRTHPRRPDGEPARPPPPFTPEVERQARRCLELLLGIRAANDRVLHRVQAGQGHWARLGRDTYNGVCHQCHLRRLGDAPPNPYLEEVCADPDLARVCDDKWVLGEAVDDYRRCIERAGVAAPAHNDLELLIRRSVTQPECTPGELKDAVNRAIQRAEQLLPAKPGHSGQ